MQLVERGSATERESFSDTDDSENLNKRTAYYEILFDLRVLNPWGVLTPLCNDANGCPAQPCKLAR